MKTKRLLAIITALILVVSLSAVVFATEGNPATEVAAVTEATTTAETTETTQEPAPWYANLGGFLPIIIICLIFYFFIIRPENKKKKEVANMRDSLAVGDEITTIGGIIGRVTSVKDDKIVIETSSEKNKIKLAKWSVSSVDKKKEVKQNAKLNDADEITEETTEE